MRIVLITGVYPGVRTGGAEVQTALLGKGLAARGHEVLYLAVEAEEERRFTTEDGVQVQELPGWAVSGAHRHAAMVTAQLRDFAPDVCYVRLLIELDSVGPICRELGIPVVSISVSHMETSPILQGGTWHETVNYWRTRRVWRHRRAFAEIRNSAVHLCNTKELAAKTRRWVKSVPVHTIYNAAPPAPPTEIHRVPGNQIIWVNNLKRLKRPELYVALARQLPQYDFVMIGAMPTSGRYAGYLQQVMASLPANLRYLGYQPLDAVNQMISESDLLLYTSVNEGFGNSFLQAWFRGVPTGSLSSRLDGILENEGVGFFAESYDEMVCQVERLMSDPPARMAMGEQALRYARTHHTIDIMVDQYERLFQQVSNNVSVDTAQRPSPAVVAEQTISKLF